MGNSVKLFVAISILVCAVAPATAQVATGEEFVDISMIGTGTGANYVPSATSHWQVIHGVALIDLGNVSTFGTGAGALRMGYGGALSSAGPSGSDGVNTNWVLYDPQYASNGYGDGNYFIRASYQTTVLISYQDDNNHYKLTTISGAKSPFGTKVFGLAKVSGGTTTWLAAGDPNCTVASTDHMEISFKWTDTTHTFSNMVITVKDSSDAYKGQCALSTVTDNTFTKGKLGFHSPSGGNWSNIDRLIFVPANSRPVVNAGAYGNNGTVNFTAARLSGGTATLALAGTLIDDGGYPPGTVSWSGAGVTFTNTAVTDSGRTTLAGCKIYNLTGTATFSASGTYTLTTSATDNGSPSLQASGSVTLLVNEAPVVTAGSPQTITLPANTVTLSGSATDDGLPNPPAALAKAWHKVFGPGPVTFNDANLPNAIATFDANHPGIYQLQYEVADGDATHPGAISTATVNITVNPPCSGFTEEFTNAAVIGTGTGVNYVPGADWEVVHSKAYVDTTGNINKFGANAGVLRLAYSSANSPGPYDVSSWTPVLYRTAISDGNYFVRGAGPNIRAFVGFQSDGNTYMLDAYRGGKGTFGTKTFGICKYVNGTATWLAAADVNNDPAFVIGANDHCEVSFTWDTTAHTFTSLQLLVKDGNNVDTLRGTATLSTVTDSGYSSGRFGPVTNGGNNTNIDRVSFVGKAASPTAVADWSEDFTSPATDAYLGSGTGANYVPGANWTVVHNKAHIDPAMAQVGGTGCLRVNYTGVGPMGVNEGDATQPGLVLRNDAMGKGVYQVRFPYSTQFVFGWQDDNNYYLVQTYSMSYGAQTDPNHPLVYNAIGDADIVVSKVVNGVKTFLGGGILTKVNKGAEYVATVRWDPANNLVQAALSAYDAGNVLLDSCETPLMNDDVGNGDGDWKTGKFGINATNRGGTVDVDKLSFANAPATCSLSDDFAVGSIGTGSGGGYVAGANWTVAHGLVKQDTAGTQGAGLGTITLNGTGGVGPNNGAPFTILNNDANCAGGQYTYRGCYMTRFVFGYQDDSNYYFAEVNKTTHGGFGDTSFAIGKVLSGTTSWLSASGSFATGSSDVFEVEINWDQRHLEADANSRIYGVVKKYTVSGSVETLAAIEATSAANDTQWNKGKFGVRESTTTTRKIDKLSYISSFCDDGVAGWGLFDPYGGHKAIKGTKTGFFHMEKVLPDRAFYVTPAGYGMTAIAVSGFGRLSGYFGSDPWLGDPAIDWWDINVDAAYTNALYSHDYWCRRKAAYGYDGSDPNTFNPGLWQQKNLLRFRTWGLSVVGEYASANMKSANVGQTKSITMLAKGGMSSTAPLGNIWAGLGVFTSGKCPDCFDPNAVASATAQMRSGNPYPNDRLTLMIHSDESDQMRGQSPTHPHLGLALLCGKPWISAQASIDAGSADETYHPDWFNCSKAAFITYLQGKYGTIANLNAAWNMTYTGWNDLNSINVTSGSDPVYGLAAPYSSVDPQKPGYPAYRTDLDYATEMFWTQWATIEKTVREAYDNNHIFMFELMAGAGDPETIPLRVGVANAMKNVRAYELFGSSAGAGAFDAVGGAVPFHKFWFHKGEPDSPLSFQGTIDKSDPNNYVQIIRGTTKYLRIYVPSDDPNYCFWYGRGGNYNIAPSTDVFVHVTNLTIAGDNNPGGARLYYCGNDNDGDANHPNRPGRPWFDLKPTSSDPNAVQLIINAINASPNPGWLRDTNNTMNQAKSADDWIANINAVINDTSFSGMHFRAGIEHWQWGDVGWDYNYEHYNEGLVTTKDNAYGPDPVSPDYGANPTRCAATHYGSDGTAGTWDDQVRDYGDFTTGFKAANLGGTYTDGNGQQQTITGDLYKRILGI